MNIIIIMDIINITNTIDKLICIYVLYYALFQKKMFKNTTKDDNIIIKKLPTNTFGVFTTIRRDQKLTKWPTDIHGCIGYWDTNFNILTQENLFYNLLRVSQDALLKDSRLDKSCRIDITAHIINGHAVFFKN